MRHIVVMSSRALIVFTILTGLIYPLAVTTLAQLLAPYAANGSIVIRDGKPIGSELIAQGFKTPSYFRSRPSSVDYGTLPGGASNLGPTNQKLKDRVAESWKDLDAAFRGGEKPYDLILTSGSGLDPHITPENAHFQAERVAVARGMDVTLLNALIDKVTENPFLGILGRARVNVLKLNLALDKDAR